MRGAPHSGLAMLICRIRSRISRWIGVNPNIYPVGDVAFPKKFTHAAMATARLCVANALNGANRPARELVIPHCTYTDPEVAQVGLTPRRALTEGVPIDTYLLDLTKVERAFIDGEEEGFAAIYTRHGSDEIGGGDPCCGACR